MNPTTRVCSDCWQIILPDAADPRGWRVNVRGECARCGQFADTYRVTRAQLADAADQPMCGTAIVEAAEARRDREDPTRCARCDLRQAARDRRGIRSEGGIV